MKLKSIKEWGIVDDKPLVISGPCSAETKEQVLAIAHELKAVGVSVFRAGVWKPRTRPNSFEGVGVESLNWLQQVQNETGLLVAVEVANEKHVQLALKAGIDILWIGARTSVNPFAVQEIADALVGEDIPVLVKNPINPDLDLWIGAVERINLAGIHKIAAIHRGFSSYESTKYRNVPNWQIPIELKRRIPHLPMLCDPSHIGGSRSLIAPLSQKALDLDMDGLMIESHITPDLAWSDAKQQITPKTLKEIIDNLIKREVKPINISLTDLEDLRHHIDNIDRELLNMLGKRMKCVEQIGQYKKDNDMTILQFRRWDSILKTRVSQGVNLGLSEKSVLTIFKAIHQESINIQETILSKSDSK